MINQKYKYSFIQIEEELNRKKEKVRFSIYDLERQNSLGFGAGGEVYLAKHKHSHKKFAMKVIPLKNDDKLKETIELEVKTHHNCDNEHIIKCYASYFSQGAINIILEYMDFGTLLDIRKKVKAIPENILGIISYQTLKGLNYLHHVKRILHRDIKPSNILLNSKGYTKISDFGVIGYMFDSGIERTTLIGTYIYMSPERIVTQSYGLNSDIWSLGMTILESALGYYPYLLNCNIDEIADIWNLGKIIVEKDPPKLPQDQFSSEFIDFINSCLIKDRLERPRTKDLMNHPFIKAYENHSPNDLAEWLLKIK